MDQDGIPPIIGEHPAEPPQPIARWRWWLHLVLLTCFPLLYGALGLRPQEKATVLPKTVNGLLSVAIFELAAFGVLFVCAWASSRATPSQLLLRWRGKGMPVVLGFAYSIGLRVLIFILTAVLVGTWIQLAGTHAQDLQNLRPKTEHLINVQVMVKSPLYFGLCLTLISFVVAAMREELWRAGMFAGINALFPKQFADWRGKAMAICFVGLLFGMGHIIQGPSGVAVTAVLGIGLGTIMLFHKSVWEAVFAHGFFDATTFAMLYALAKYYPHQIPGLG